MNLRIGPLAGLALAALAGINLWPLTVIFAGTGSGEPVPVAAPAWDAKLAVSGRDHAVAKPISAYGQMLAQPVFFKSREPYVPARLAPPAAPVVVAKPPPPVVVDPGFAVAGIVIGEGMRKAFILGKSEPHGSWVAEGESLTGWKVQAIDAGGVKLQQQDHMIELQLYPAK